MVYLTDVDSCWLVLILVGLVLTRFDSCWLVLTLLGWHVSKSCWLVSDSCWFMLIRVDLCWYSCIGIDLIFDLDLKREILNLDWHQKIESEVLHISEILYENYSLCSMLKIFPKYLNFENNSKKNVFLFRGLKSLY